MIGLLIIVIKIKAGCKMNSRNLNFITIAYILIVVTSPAHTFAGQSFVYSTSFSNWPIPADPCQTLGWMNDAVIEVTDHLAIHDLDVSITLTHTSAFDLQLFLLSPDQTTICLNLYDPFSGFFEGENYTYTIFDDEAAISIEQADAPFTGRFKPLEPYKLSAFDGIDAFGQWHLQVYDAHYNDTGYFQNFQLHITTPEPTTLFLLTAGFAFVKFFNCRKHENNIN